MVGGFEAGVVEGEGVGGLVAPHAGAWIETARRYTPGTEVVPRLGTWIEMTGVGPFRRRT